MTLTAKELRGKLESVPDSALVVCDLIDSGDGIKMVTVTSYDHPHLAQFVTLYNYESQELPQFEIRL